MLRTIRRTSQALRLIAISTALLRSTTGCASKGTTFDPTVVEHLKPGTTLDEIKKQLGKPNQKSSKATATSSKFGLTPVRTVLREAEIP
jgi:hypothetical protein